MSARRPQRLVDGVVQLARQPLALLGSGQLEAWPARRALEIAAAAWSAMARRRSAWAAVKNPLVTLSSTTKPMRRSPIWSAAPSAEPAGPSAQAGSSTTTDSRLVAQLVDDRQRGHRSAAGPRVRRVAVARTDAE